MANVCNKFSFSAKFLPVIKRKQKEFVNNPQGFTDWILNNFDNAEEVLGRFGGELQGSPTLTPDTVQQIDTKQNIEVNAEKPSDNYKGGSTNYRNLVRNFNANIIERSIFNRNSPDNKFIDAEGIESNGISKLNNSIFKYKIEQLNKVLSYLNLNPVIEPITDLDTLTDLFEMALVEYETAMEDFNGDKDSAYYDAYNSYTILNKFESLLANNTPFIKVKPEYKKTAKFIIDKYTYVGPNVQQYTGFTTDENMDANDHVSDLSKVLLDYLPEINSEGREIPNTAITLIGFESVMSKIIQSSEYIPEMENFSQQIYDEGVNLNLANMIDAYITSLQSDKIQSENMRSYLLNKARAIRNFIYDKDMPQEVREMFNAMAYKIIPSSYTTYDVDPTKKRTTARDLKEGTVRGERFNLNRALVSTVDNFINNKEQWKQIKDKYNISINGDIVNIGTGKISFVKRKSSVTDTESFEFGIEQTMDSTELENATFDILAQLIPEGIDEIAKEVNPLYARSNSWSHANLYMPVLAAAVLGIDKVASFKNNPIADIQANKGSIVDTYQFYNTIDDLAKVLSVANGSDTLSIIKNAEGNNLPTYQINSLVNHFPTVVKHVDEQVKLNPDRQLMLTGNLLYRNEKEGKRIVLPPSRRTEININGKIKGVSEITTAEALQTEAVYDFYQNIESGIIGLQATTYADKNTHWIQKYNIGISLDDGFNLKSELKSLLQQRRTSETSSAYDKIVKFIQEARAEEYNILVNNIIKDYNTVYNQSFETLQEVGEFVKGKAQSSIQTAFVKAGIVFIPNIHGYGKGDSFIVNETIENYHRIFNNEKLFKERLETEKRKFVADLLDNKFYLNANDTSIENSFGSFNGWFNPVTGEIQYAKIKDKFGKEIDPKSFIKSTDLLEGNYSVVLHPILDAYYLTNTLLVPSYMNMMMGGVYAHDNKDRDTKPGDPNFFTYSEASRLIAQDKRAVIMGATFHPLTQGKRDGVSSNIRIAVINDEKGKVFNILGNSDKVDSMDGSGFTDPKYSRLANNSLIDASVGKDKKTIFHDINATYGNPVLLKWAEYEIDNEMRRWNPHGEISAEQVFKKMNSSIIDTNVDYGKYFNNALKQHPGGLYFFDYSQDKYFFIDTIQNTNGANEVYRKIIEVNDQGVIVGDPIEEFLTVNNFYDVDQLFGGAFSMIMDNNDKLIDSDHNIDIALDIMIQEDIRDKMIAHLVNKSAIKVGASNINPVTSWKDDSELYTMPMSTRFGGVQMDAEHHLEFSEVTEMTQMLNSLVQAGYTHDMVTRVYQDIGKVVAESLGRYTEVINNKDKAKLYDILARSLIQSFETGDTETIGLAQSFVKLAQKSLQRSDLEFTLPFSANTINGKFISVVSSNLVKAGIKRKYAGIGAVQNPSNNIMQYWTVDGQNLTFKELAKIANQSGIQSRTDENGKLITPIERLMTEAVFTVPVLDELGNAILDELGQPLIEYEVNPMSRAIDKNEIDFEDTIIMWNSALGVYDQKAYSKPFKVDSFETFDMLKSIPNRNIVFYRWEARPKNLKGTNLFFTVQTEFGPQEHSLYDLDSVRASNYIGSVKSWDKLTPEQITVIQNVIPDANSLDGLSEKLQAATQQQLEIIDTTGILPYNSRFGQVQVLSSRTQPSQIIMGRNNASKLGLQKGDTIAEIKKQQAGFFYKRMKNNYQITNIDRDTFDFVLYKEGGTETYIKFANDDQLSDLASKYKITDNTDYSIVDEEVFYNGQSIGTNHDKKFKKIKSSDGKVHDLIIISNLNRLRELLKSSVFESIYKTNYTNENLETLLKYNFAKNIEAMTSINLDYYINNEVNTKTIDLSNGLNLDSFTTTLLNQNDELKFNKNLQNLAQDKYTAFEKQLLFVGARIPTQSMQSFAPMEVVAYTDSDVNEVYIPKQTMWLAGSKNIKY